MRPRLLVVAATLSIASFESTLAAQVGSVGKDVTDEIIKNEVAAIDAFRTHDKETFKRLCLPSFYEVTSDGGVNPLADELKELDDYVLIEYQMKDVVVTRASDDVALVRYKINASYSFHGKPLPAHTMLATAVWVKVGDDWRAATYEEVQLASRSSLQ
jgi:hypothetical protein